MESVIGSFSRCGCVLALALAVVALAGNRAAAQPPQGTVDASQNSPQPFPDAAQPAKEPGNDPGKGSDDKANPASLAKDSSDASLVKLGPGDLIDMSVFNVPELSTKARVSNSGDVYLPLIDYVHIAGLTQEEAQTVIEKRLDEGGFVRNPHVTIFVDEASSQSVTIIGEVGKPGIYPDPINRKLYDIISEAGGFTLSASRKIVIIRNDKPMHIDLPRNLGDDLGGNVEVLPGDTITVPRAPIIYVVGDVGRPSGLLVDNGALTVLQALALAGGANHTAKLSGARIIRKTPTGMTETTVQLKKMLEAKTADVPLQADDILFIPVSGGRVLAARTMEVAMSAATAVTIYSVHP